MPKRPPAADWTSWPDQRLLDLRLCDLGLSLEDTLVGRCIERLDREMAERGFRFRPHYWIAEDWFTPDGVPGVAVPFYLTHPRLARLERNQVMEVEGGNRTWCMRILRHELGHAIDNAYRLRRRRRRQQLFGLSSEPYPDHYTPKPYSRRFVQHLDAWYAQSHPDEDFAETFAVWFGTRGWRRRYAGWPALDKLRYVDELMGEIAPQKPLVTTRRTVDPVQRLRKTLREVYAEKRERFGLDYPNFYDRDLLRLFSNAPHDARHPTAASFVRKLRRGLRAEVARWTGASQYTIDQVLADITGRCQELDLRATGTEDEMAAAFTVLVTVHTMNYLHGGGHRLAL